MMGQDKSGAGLGTGIFTVKVEWGPGQGTMQFYERITYLTDMAINNSWNLPLD